MATHFSILAWEIPWTEEPGGPQSMGHKTVGQKLASKNKRKSHHQCVCFWEVSHLLVFSRLLKIPNMEFHEDKILL